jgi:molybdate transport system substrate-binding protein
MRFTVVLLLVVLAASARLIEAGETRIAAASSLHHALPEIVDAFERATGHTSKLTFGASGNLARQIVQGAPFEVFLSANEEYVEFLKESGVTEGAGIVYALGRLVLFIPEGSRVTSTPDLNGLSASQRDGRLKRIAIANPQHAPYGVAARKALQGAGLWEELLPRLVMGENVSQATQFALTGAVDAAVISLSNVLLLNIENRGTHVVVDDRLYPPLRQRMALIKGSGIAAAEFYTFMRRSEVRAVLSRHGFGQPGDAITSGPTE